MLFHAQGRKKKGGDGKDEHRDEHGSDATRISSSADLYSETLRKTKSYDTDQQQSSIFFGYDLPDDITEDEILSFLEEFQHSIVTIEVVLNEKCGNYAKVTFATHSDAQAAIQQYNNQPWYDIGINVTLKPWKDRKEFASPPKKHISCKYIQELDILWNKHVRSYVCMCICMCLCCYGFSISWPQLYIICSYLPYMQAVACCI